MNQKMPSVDQQHNLDQPDGQAPSDHTKHDVKTYTHISPTCNGSHNLNDTDINGKFEQNGHVTMETKLMTKTLNAHLVKNEVICLDKIPVNPVASENESTERTQNDDIKNGEKVVIINHENICKESTLKQNGVPDVSSVNTQGSTADEFDKSTLKMSAVEESMSRPKLSRKPLSFDLLPDKISKTHTPSRRGKLARQRTISDTSYEKECRPLIPTKSDPTNFVSYKILEEEKEDESLRKEAKESKLDQDTNAKKDCKQECTTKPKQEQNGSPLKNDVDTLAENLNSSLKISTKSGLPNANILEKEENQEISDLSTKLEKGLSVTDDVDDDKESNEVFIKKEPEDTDEFSGVIIIKKEATDMKDSSCMGDISQRILEETADKMVSRGVGDNLNSVQTQYRDQISMNIGQHKLHNRSYSSQIPMVPEFQKNFIQQFPYQMKVQPMRPTWLSQQKMQYNQPACFNQHQNQPIVVPPLPQRQPIMVPPVGVNNQKSEFDKKLYKNQQLPYDQNSIAQNQFSMMIQPTQSPMVVQQTQNPMVVLPQRQPVQAEWIPSATEHLEDGSDTSSICSPPRIESNDPLASPHSVRSDVSSVYTADHSSLNPMSPLDNQGSPLQGVFPTSPYHRVPSSPEIPPVHSPLVASSPGSPPAHIVTKSKNIGTVWANDTSKPSSPKRQCLDEKEKEIGNLVNFLKEGSPDYTPDWHLQQPMLQSATPVRYYPPLSPVESCTSSCDSPSPGPNNRYLSESQLSPSPGMHPVGAVETSRQMASIQRCYPTTHVVQYTEQTMSTVAMTPTQGANQQEFESWVQKVGRLTDEQLREQDVDNDTVLHLTIIQEQEEKFLMQALIERLKHTDAMNMKNKLSQTPVYLAAVMNRPEFVYELIKNGADPRNTGEKPGDTPLHIAARQGYVGVIKAIFLGMDGLQDDFIDMNNYDGKSPLHCAVESHGEKDSMNENETIDSLQTIRVLMKYGASAMCQDGKSGKTPLHVAIEMHKKDITQLLLEICENPGELVNSKMYNGNTALHLVVGHPRINQDEILEMVALLMNKGANVSIENAEKETPIKLVPKDHDVVKQHLSGQAHNGVRQR